MNTAIINSFGFESGGMTTLCLYYSKLGFDVYIKDKVHPLKYKMSIENANIYNSDDELLDISKKYDRLIFLPPAYKSDLKSGLYEKAFLPIFDIRKNNPNVELCYLYCSRDSDDFIDYLLPVLTRNNFDFDHYFSITPKLLNIKSNVKCFDINAFIFDGDVNIRYDSDIVFTAGRVEGFKGVVKYFDNINFDSGYTYVHEGAGYNFNKNGNVSVPLQLLNVKNNPNVLFKQYGDVPVINKLNIYPTYKLEDAKYRWSNYFAGICCIMGTKTLYKKGNTLFDKDTWFVDNKAEDTLISKQSKLWGIGGLEYANLEMINIGIPVLFSRGYSNIIGFNDDRLIYNRFSEIPTKLDKLKSHDVYEDTIKYQREFFIKKQADINKTIIDIFRGEII